MSTSPKFNPEELEDYLAGSLSLSAREGLENRLESDADLAREIHLRRDVEVAISDREALRFQRTLHQVGQEFHRSTTTAKVFRLGRKPWLRVAAAVLLLFAALTAAWMVGRQTPVAGSEIYATYFTTYPLKTSFRGAADPNSASTPYQSGIALYEDQAYEAAAEVFSDLLVKEPDNPLYAFALAQSYLNQEPLRAEAAAKELEKVIQDGKTVYVIRAKWYLALLHLRDGDTEAAKPLLQAVIDAGDLESERARSLYRKIK